MITGYIVTRKPVYDFDEQIIGRRKIAEPVNGIYYNGIDRLNWIDVETLFHQGMIPENLLKKYKELKASDNDFTGIKILKDYNDANEFLSLDNSLVEMNEVIVISSDKLNEIKGGMPLPEEKINWLGYDVVLLGGWSLIRHAIFENRKLNLLNTSKINSFGLFDNPDMVSSFQKEYNLLADTDQLDPILTDTAYGIDCIRVGHPVI